MSYAVTHRGFLGDAERDFTLDAAMMLELERATDCGLGTLFRRVLSQDFRSADIGAVIRLGLIGAGTAPQEASRLVAVYVEGRPLMEVLPLAVAILEARFYGRAEEPAPKMPAVDPVSAPPEPVAPAPVIEASAAPEAVAAAPALQAHFSAGIGSE